MIYRVIIDNVPYYYKVTFIDENGDVKQGYVSKRSVQLIEGITEVEESETESQTDLE